MDRRVNSAPRAGIRRVAEKGNSYPSLYAKSQSFANSNYDWKNYKDDLAKYEQSVQDYMAIGGCLNELFEKVK